MNDYLTPKAVVAALDAHIIGQDEAKRAVAVALRNRWRRQQLPEELRDVFLAGGRVVVREFHAMADVLDLPEPLIFNCTGLGARALVGDQDLVPVKGQLTVLLPQPEIDYVTLQGGLYMMPRRDGILLGGTYEFQEWSLEPNREAEAEILAGHAEFFAAMRANGAAARAER